MNQELMTVPVHALILLLWPSVYIEKKHGDSFYLQLKRIPEYQHTLWGHRDIFVKTAFYSSLHVIGVFFVFEGTMSISRGLSVWVEICRCKALYNQLPLLWTPLGLQLSVPNSKSL